MSVVPRLKTRNLHDNPWYSVQYQQRGYSAPHLPDAHDRVLLADFLESFGVENVVPGSDIRFVRNGNRVEMSARVYPDGAKEPCPNCARCTITRKVTVDVGTSVPDFRSLVTGYGTEDVVSERRELTDEEQARYAIASNEIFYAV